MTEAVQTLKRQRVRMILVNLAYFMVLLLLGVLLFLQNDAAGVTGYLLVAACLAGLFFTLLAFLFLRLFLRTGRLVQGRQVYMPLHLELGSGLRRMVQAEHTVRFRTDGIAPFLQECRLPVHGVLLPGLGGPCLFRFLSCHGRFRFRLSRTGRNRSLLFLRSINRPPRPQVIQVDMPYDFRPLS